MILPPADAKDFFRLIQALDVFFESRLHLLKGTSLEEIRRLRMAGFADPGLLKAYVSENPDNLPQADLHTVLAWQHAVEGRFMVHQERKDGCLFSHAKDETLYLVLGLTQPISELVPFVPVYVETWLLPFRGHIVTDGIIAPIMMHFSPRMAKHFMAGVKERIVTRGLVTTLPPAATPSAPAPAALLKHYLSTVASRRDFAVEIISLSHQSPVLRVQYLQHMGKLNSKSLKASLRAQGITEGWFAIVNDTIIAGAADKARAAACAAELVSADLLDGIVWLNAAH